MRPLLATRYLSKDVWDVIDALAARSGIGRAVAAERVARAAGRSRAWLYRHLKLKHIELVPDVALLLGLATTQAEASARRLYRRRVPATRSVFSQPNRDDCIPLPAGWRASFLRAETWHWGADPLDSIEEIVRTLPFLHFTDLAADKTVVDPIATAIDRLDEYLLFVTCHIVASYGIADSALVGCPLGYEGLLQQARKSFAVAQNHFKRFEGCLRIPEHVFHLGDYVSELKEDLRRRGLPLIIDLTGDGRWKLAGPSFWKRVLGRHLRGQRFFTGMVEGPFYDSRGARHVVAPDTLPCRDAAPGSLILIPGVFEGSDFTITEDPIPFCRYSHCYVNRSVTERWLWPCIQDGRAADNASDGYCRFVCKASGPTAQAEADRSADFDNASKSGP